MRRVYIKIWDGYINCSATIEARIQRGSVYASSHESMKVNICNKTTLRLQNIRVLQNYLYCLLLI